MLKAAHAHQGAAFIEIFQNCIVYNKDVFDDFAAAQGRRGPPAVAEGRRADAVRRRRPRASRSTARRSRCKVVDVADGDWQAAGVIVHDVQNRSIAHMLVEMPFGPFPMALGVLYDDPRRPSKAR